MAAWIFPRLQLSGGHSLGAVLRLLVAGQGLCAHSRWGLWREGSVAVLQKCNCKKEAGLGWENTFLLKRGPYISAGGDILVKAKKNKKHLSSSSASREAWLVPKPRSVSHRVTANHSHAP